MQLTRLLSSLFLVLAPAMGLAEVEVPLSTLYAHSQDGIVKALCEESGVVRSCILKDASACQSAASTSYTSCYKADLAKRKSMSILPHDAAALGQELLVCTTKTLYTALHLEKLSSDANVQLCLIASKKESRTASVDQSFLNSYLNVQRSVATTDGADEPESSSRSASTIGTSLTVLMIERMRIRNTYFENLRVVATKDPKSLCPDYKGRGQTGCLASVVAKIPLSASRDFAYGIMLVAEAAARDRVQFGHVQSSLDLLAASFDILDRVRPDEFYVSTVKTTTHAQQKDKMQVIRIENEALAQLKQLVLSNLPKALSAIENSPKSKEMKARMAKLRSASWAISGFEERK